MKVLVIKMSSLGDVVHALPALTDGAAHGVRFDWVVEEAFASIPARHPAVDRVIPIGWRRWRSNPWRHRAALADFVRQLRTEQYDLVIDAQGLLKSAAVVALARASSVSGLSFTSAREPAAAFFYNRRIAVPLGGHAVDRLRRLFADALGYPVPQTAADFGLERSFPSLKEVPANQNPGESGRCLLLHGTTWDSKHWPQSMWQALAGRLQAAGWRVEVPWGSEPERARARDIAAAADSIRVLESMPLIDPIEQISQAGLVVGVDSGLTHLAAALAVPTVVIYGSTSAERTGARGARVVNLQSDLACSPCLRRSCRYRGEALRWQGEVVSPACYARLAPERIGEEVQRLLEESA